MVINDDDIEFIKKQYLFCTPVNKFNFTASNATCEEALDYNEQIKIFESTIEDSCSIKYPSRLSYRISFLRMLIEKSEKNGEDVYDKLYESLTNYMMLNDDANQIHYRQFLLSQRGNEDRIILQESKNLISEGTTGLRTWQAGFALAEWCNENKAKIDDKLILELGSGVGLTGLSVMKTCSPKRYTFTDCHSSVLDMLMKNVRINLEIDDEINKIDKIRTVEWNEVSYKCKYRNTDVRITRLEWTAVSESDSNTDSWASPQVVLAADVIYDESLFDEFIEALDTFITRTNALVIVAATVRNNDTILTFFRKLENYGLTFDDEKLPKSNLFLEFDDTPVRILKIFKNKQ